MKTKEIHTGRTYLARVNGVLRSVRVDDIREAYNGRAVYDVTNLATGRKTTFRSPAKFRGELQQPCPRCKAQIVKGEKPRLLCVRCTESAN